MSDLRATLRAFTEAWTSGRMRVGEASFEAGLTDPTKGIHNSRQTTRVGARRPDRAGMPAGARPTTFEGARLSTRQIMGVEELPHRDRRVPASGGGGAAPVTLPSGLPFRVASKVAYAKGAQPAFFKIISGAAGRGRAGALFNYLGTREDPETGEKVDIELTTQDGRTVDGKAARASLLDEWEDLFDEARPAIDVWRMSIGIHASGPLDRAAVGDLVGEAIGADRRFVYAVRDHGEGAHTLTVAMSTKRAEKSGRGLDEMHDAFVAAVKRRGETLTFTSSDGSGRGFAGIKHQLDRFAHGDFGDAYGDDGATFEASRSRAEAAAWAKAVGRSRPNDVIHTVFSARPGTDAAAFRRAVLSTLDENFGGFRFVVAGHDDKRHVHIHAVIQTRNAAGERLRVSKGDLDRIRSTLAEKARDEGIAMVHMTRADLASAPPYTRQEAAAVREGRAGPRTTERVRAKTADAGATVVPPGDTVRRKAAVKEWRAAADHLMDEVPRDDGALAAVTRMFRKFAVNDNDRDTEQATSRRRPTVVERSNGILKEAMKAMSEAETLPDLMAATWRAHESIERLAEMAAPEDAVKLREQSAELARLANAQAALMQAELKEAAAAQTARMTDPDTPAGQAAQRELSRDAEELHRAAVNASIEAGNQDPGIAVTDPTDRKVHRIAEDERAIARTALEKAERDGASAEEISRLKAAYGATLRKPEPEPDREAGL